MRNIILGCVLLFSVASCTNKKEIICNPVHDTVRIYGADTLYLNDTSYVKDKRAMEYAYVYLMTIKRLQKRIRIVTSNKSQIIFLKGWTNRIVDSLPDIKNLLK